jgi:hypothetical protein
MVRAVSNGAGSFDHVGVDEPRSGSVAPAIDEPRSGSVAPVVDAGDGARQRPARARGFSIGCDGAGELGCVDVRGFRDALRAARDPNVAAPQRFVVVGPDAPAVSWLDAWAEDVARVRRNIVVSRAFDGEEITAIVTIAAHGYGIETSLAIESLRGAQSDSSDDIFRSGVHLKVDIRI